MAGTTTTTTVILISSIFYSCFVLIINYFSSRDLNLMKSEILFSHKYFNACNVYSNISTSILQLKQTLLKNCPILFFCYKNLRNPTSIYNQQSKKKHTLALDTECISLTRNIILHFSRAINSLVQIHSEQKSKNQCNI